MALLVILSGCKQGTVENSDIVGQAASRTQGYLFVNSTPIFANLYVDNSFKGLTPITVTLSVGQHQVNVTKSGYRSFSNITYIYARKTTVLNLNLTPLNQTNVNETNQTGNLYVSSNPTNASLYVDALFRGITPALITGLVSGYHKVNVTKTGYYDYSNTTFIYPNQTTTLNVTLNRTI